MAAAEGDSGTSPPSSTIAAATAHRRSSLRFGVDVAGDEVLEMVAPAAPSQDGALVVPTRGSNRVVMMRWEQPYMEALVEALDLQEADEVLEIGFGLGYSAAAIQRRRPRRHVVIEPDPAVLVKAHAWAIEAQAANPEGEIEIVPGFWQTVLPKLSRHFDAVFLDDFPLPLDTHEEDDGGGSGGSGSSGGDEGVASREHRRAQRDERRILAELGSRWHAFLDLVVSHHLRLNGRVTGYLSEDLDLGRPGVSYTRSTFEVVVPDHCPYALPGRQSYHIPIVQLVDEGLARGAVTTGRRRGDAEIKALDDEGGGGKKPSKRQRMADFVLAARGEA